MAADIYGLLRGAQLPPGWQYSVSADGRVFFINDNDRTTSWLHPVTGEPIQTGHMTSLDLPKGWELGYAQEGIRYYIDHNRQITTFTNPNTRVSEAVSRRSSVTPYKKRLDHLHSRIIVPSFLTEPASYLAPPSPIYSTISNFGLPASANLADKHLLVANGNGSQGFDVDESNMRLRNSQIHGPAETAQYSPASQSDNQLEQGDNGRSSDSPGLLNGITATSKSQTNAPLSPRASTKKARESVISKPNKKHHRRSTVKTKLDAPSIKVRCRNSPVAMRGWLYRQETQTAGIRSWKKRYFVLSEFCLYAYKDESENESVGAVLLPSYKIELCPNFSSSKKFTFKAYHVNTKTCYFAADHREDMTKWMNAMSLASVMKRHYDTEQEYTRTAGDGMDSAMGQLSLLSPAEKEAGFGYPNRHHRPLYPVSSYDAQQDIRYRSPEPAVRVHHGYRDESLHTSSYRSPPGELMNSPMSPGNMAYYPGTDRSYSVNYQDQPDYPNYHNRHHEYPYNDYRDMPRYNSQPNNQYIHERPDVAKSYSTPNVRSTPHRPVHSQPYLRVNSGYNMSNNSNKVFTNGQDYTSPAQSSDVTSDGKVRGEPRTPPSAVEPPWKRNSGHTPTYRPPTHENKSPARPPMPASYRDERVREIVRNKPSNAQQDFLQATHNQQKRLGEPLIFQFPEPQRWRKNDSEGLTSRSAYENIAVQKNHENNSRMHENGGQADSISFKPPSTVATHDRLTSDDLVGKSQEELVLLLIELRREYSQLELSLDVAKQRMTQAKEELSRVQLRNAPGSSAIKQDIDELYKYMQLTNRQMQVQRPVINLVDNVVKMSSLYGNRNSDIAQRYNQGNRQVMEFSGRIQEEQLSWQQSRSRHQIDAGTLDKKLSQLYGADRDVQEQSFIVNSLTEEMNMLSRALNNTNEKLQHYQYPSHETNKLLAQRRNVEEELIQVRKQLADASRKFEELSAHAVKLQEDVVMIKSELNNNNNSNVLTQSKMKDLQMNVQKTQNVMNDLQRQGRDISDAMSALRHPSKDSSAYNETDLDSMTTRNIALKHQNGVVGRKTWGMEEADDNMKRFYGILPKEKPRVTTVRDVKRASAIRQEQKENKDLHMNGHAMNGNSGIVYQQRRPASGPVLEPPHLSKPASKGNMPRGKGGPPTVAQKPKMRGKAQTGRKENRERYLTISSSKPISMEASSRGFSWGHPSNYTQDDLAMVDMEKALKSSKGADRDYTEDVIDSQFLAPQKVHIPERYIPDSSDEEEILSPEEQQIRAKKAEKIRKLVASQSAENAFQISRESVAAHRAMLRKVTKRVIPLR